VLSVVAGAILYLAVFVSAVFGLLFILLGPLAAALMHSAVKLVREDDLRFRDALVGLRRHWRRGVLLMTIILFAAWSGLIAVRFYGSEQWLLTVLVGDALVVFAAVQLLAWPRAVEQPDRPLRHVVTDALSDFLSRPVSTLGFALALVIVNVLGIAAGVMPFLTLTVAYSFLAAAHFALRPNDE
jgi:hypothetical protein